MCLTTKTSGQSQMSVIVIEGTYEGQGTEEWFWVVKDFPSMVDIQIHFSLQVQGPVSQDASRSFFLRGNLEE